MDKLLKEALEALKSGYRVLHQHAGSKRRQAAQMREAIAKIEGYLEVKYGSEEA